MILERTPLSPKLLDSEIAKSQARTNTHKEWAIERLHDLERGDTATLRRFSRSVKVAPAITSTQVLGKVVAIKDQPTQPHGRPSPPSKSLPSSIPNFPRALTEPTAHSKVTIAFSTKDPTSTSISCRPVACTTITIPTEHLHNQRNDISVRSEPRALEEKQASNADPKVLGSAPHSEYTETFPPYAMVCDETPSLHPPTEKHNAFTPTNNQPPSRYVPPGKLELAAI